MIDALVKPLYMTEPDLFECDAIVVSVGVMAIKDVEHFFIRLNQTLFHPHGGGQLSDIGTINGLAVAFVNKHKLDENNPNLFEIEHCFTEDPGLRVGDSVHLKVDPENRYANSLWHTAAHIVDYAVVHSFPNLKGHSGQCYPNAAFMKFTLESGQWPDLKALEAEVNKAIREVKNLPSRFVEEEGIRKLAIGEHRIPCGGTHVHHLDEVGTLTVKKASLEKKALLKVSFQIL